MSGAHLSKDFFELIKNIGECKSKQVRARAGPRGPQPGRCAHPPARARG